MKKQPESPSTELMSVDISTVVKEAQEEVVFSTETPEEAQQLSTTTSWEDFLQELETLQTRKNNSKHRKQAFYIENTIVEVLDSCNINNSSSTNIINSALLTFIRNHKHYFRENLKPSPTLIQ